MVPPGVGGEKFGIGQHVAVEEDENGMRCRFGAGVARRRQAEVGPFPADEPDVERRRRKRQGWLGAVVHDDHLEEVTRTGLPLQGRQRPRQLLRRLETGHDHRHRQRRYERGRRRHVQLPPIVVPRPIGADVRLRSAVGIRPAGPACRSARSSLAAGGPSFAFPVRSRPGMVVSHCFVPWIRLPGMLLDIACGVPDTATLIPWPARIALHRRRPELSAEAYSLACADCPLPLAGVVRTVPRGRGAPVGSTRSPTEIV